MAKFQKGNRFGRGRPKGSPNRASVIGRSMLEHLEGGDDDLPPAIDRWKALLTDRDASVRLAAEKFLFVALYGLPRPATVPPAGDLTCVLTFGDEIPGQDDRPREIEELGVAGPDRRCQP